MPILSIENIEPIERNDLSTGRYLIEPFLQAGKTSEGLELAEGDGHATPVYGRVISASPGCRFKVGECVLFRRYAIDILKAYTAEGEKEVYILEDQEAIGIVHGEVESKKKQSNTAQIDERKNNGKDKPIPKEGREASEEKAA